MKKRKTVKDSANCELGERIVTSKCFLINRKSLMVSLLVLLAGIQLALMLFSPKEFVDISAENDNLVQLSVSPAAVVSGKKGIIAIPSGMVKANPFVPYRDLGNTSVVPDVPTYNLVEPPEMINENSDAARVMDTTVSGILYDKYSPSAILNIEGNDYLVKKGDVVNNYKILSIMKDSVTVKLGTNVYNAGIGEILTEGTLNRNDVSNLNNKFGGVRK